MPAGRYHYFNKQRFAARCRSLRKRPLLRDKRYIIVILGFIIVYLLSASPFGASLVFHAANLRAVLNNATKLDYIVFICHSLPGMHVNTAAEEIEGSPGETLSGLQFSFQAKPERFLYSELAGFKALGTASALAHLPSISDYELDDNLVIVDDPFVQELAEETGANGVAFLLDKKGENVREKPFVIKDNKPLILIYHTHASESFVPLSGQAFSNDPAETVVSLGAFLAELLEKKYGIPVLHHKEVFDIPRQSAYEKARPCIEEVLKQNPQIQVVLDLHRDGVPRQVTTASVAGQNSAKILFVIDARHEGWHNNMRFALYLEKALAEKFPGLSRNILRSSSVRQTLGKCPSIYNQDLHPRSLIVEVGGHENNREEITAAISCLAEVLAAVLQ